jgi:uncharacterized protein (DUF58 family)
VTTRLTTKPAAYGLLAVAAIFGGLASRRPEFVVLGIPFALGLVVALTSTTQPLVRLSASSPARVIEGDDVNVELSLQAERPLGLVEIVLRLPAGLEPASRGTQVGLVVAGAGSHKATIVLRATRWGSWHLGPLAWRSRDPGGFVTFEQVLDARLSVRVHPRPEQLRHLLRPATTRALTGSHTARATAEGIEFAEVRSYSASDGLRKINWRVSTRRGELWVNGRHPERNADVVVFVDTFAEAALVPAVRVAVNVVSAYLAQRDRVGVVGFGGIVQWVEPSLGTRHLYRLLDVLLSTNPMFSYAWKDLHVLPPRTLPPDALVLVVSGLDDERLLGAVDDLVGRGVDLAVIEMPLQKIFPPGPREQDRLAHRLWCLRRRDRREQLRRRGVPVVEWTEELPVAAALEEMAGFRRKVGRRQA